MNITLADTIREGMNNPECSFFVGHMVGGYNNVMSLVFLIAVWWSLGMVYNSFFSPLSKYVGNKFLGWLDKKRK